MIIPVTEYYLPVLYRLFHEYSHMHEYRPCIKQEEMDIAVPEVDGTVISLIEATVWDLTFEPLFLP